MQSSRLWAAALAAGLALSAAAPASAVETRFGNVEDQKNIITAICGTQVKLDDKGCRCLAERAITDLDDPQRAFLILSVVQPTAAERTGIAHSKPDLTTIALFIESARKACSGEAESAPGSTAPADGAPTTDH